jgi:hypothetical protein
VAVPLAIVGNKARIVPDVRVELLHFSSGYRRALGLLTASYDVRAENAAQRRCRGRGVVV